jgi:hypothetical protein
MAFPQFAQAFEHQLRIGLGGAEAVAGFTVRLTTWRDRWAMASSNALESCPAALALRSDRLTRVLSKASSSWLRALAVSRVSEAIMR